VSLRGPTTSSAFLGHGDTATFNAEKTGIDTQRTISTSLKTDAWALSHLTKPLSKLLHGSEQTKDTEPSSSRTPPPSKTTNGSKGISRRRKFTARAVRRRPVRMERTIRKSWKEELEEIQDMEIPKEKQRLVRELQPLHPRRKPRALVGSAPVVPALEPESTPGKLIVDNLLIRTANETVVPRRNRKGERKCQSVFTRTGLDS
jgi:hypothetical protein